MKQFSDIHYTILGLLSTCGWVSLPLLELLDYGYTYRTRALKTLLDGQFIRKSGKGRAKAYAISAKGRNLLAAYNTRRFGGEAKGMAKQLARHPERSVQRGDAAAFLSFGGFSVHPDDKPAFPAYTPDPSGEDWRGLYRNTESHSYPDQPDQGVYRRRLTAVNCYYDATAVKDLAVDSAGVGYSRACGVLMTPSYLLRVYHSRDVAMKFQSTGEQNLQSLLLSGRAFTGYLPEEQNAALILGTGFTAALHILEHHLAGYSSRMPLSAKKKGGKGYTAVKGLAGELVTPTNLGKPAFYLPLCKESLPLLRLMAYPFWQGFLVREICHGLWPDSEQPHWCFEEDGYAVYILAAMNLAQIDLAMRMVQGNSGKKVRIVCLDWQEPLFRPLLEPFAGHRDLWLTKLPAGFLEGLLQREKEYWEGADAKNL